ncbi:hypothetical protein CVT26_002328 [Gymnopilus dilepis]|uniref:Cation/H+ exchanger transmembrane domain-containing protein n=1 Tax=Gymnopilus dilepis TaxID=231916 RepID=A0A409Y3I5_9AGAR|nr:hypothetical protein CVT26_002328 [Gymnopilus dilepis]
MPEFSSQLISLFAKSATAPEQGGLLSGKDPTAFNTADPLRLWIIQVGIIVCTSSLLSHCLRKVRQPKVIAEVLGGIILGPTAFGRIPGFTKHIFPEESRPYLSLVANIGLCFFLFLVGLEIDTGVIKRNARLSAIVAIAGMVVPFGVGAGLSSAIYKRFIDPDIKFTYFMLFAAVAYSITAFPVLCRILTELKLLDTTVGIVVLSAGVGNDIVGWILLALSVALVNGGAGLTALYILLTCLGWTLFLLFPVKMALARLARVTGSTQNGPSVLFMTVTMLILFGSAFFTDVIGVHAIFGAFVAGVIVPREGGLTITMTEKLEDLVSIVFLPLYFTLSGLSTDLGLLNNGITWGYTIAIIIAAFVGKFGGCTVAAHFVAGFNWRESSTIGSLMSCKGLIELIVLNVGLSAGILSRRVFSMFVLEALVLTFMTTPLVTWLYPPHLRHRIAATGFDFEHPLDDEKRLQSMISAQKGACKLRFTVVLDRLEHLPGIMALTQLLQPPPPPYQKTDKLSIDGEGSVARSINANALRLIELSDRVSDVMKGSVPNSLLLTDPLLSIFHMFGQLNGMKVTPTLSVVRYEEQARRVVEHARNFGSDMILISWLPPVPDAFKDPTAECYQPQQGSTAQTPSAVVPDGPPAPAAIFPSGDVGSKTPLDTFPRSSNSKYPAVHGHFGSSTTSSGECTSNSVSIVHTQFVREVFARVRTDVALFVDQRSSDSSSPFSFLGAAAGLGEESPEVGTMQHMFLPFFGGADDRLALEFVVHICTNPRIRATVVRITKTTEVVFAQDVSIATPQPAHLKKNGLEGARLEDITAHSHDSTQVADDAIWTRYASTPGVDHRPGGKLEEETTTTSPSHFSSHPQITFRTISTPTPLHAAIQAASEAAFSDDSSSPQRRGEVGESKLVVVTGRSRQTTLENVEEELKDLAVEHQQVGSEVRHTLGNVATAFIVSGVGLGIVVLQAGERADLGERDDG